MDDLDLGVTIKGFAAGQKVFQRYTLKKILGRGGMGVVWLARDDTLEIDVALKFLPEVVAMDKEAIRDLKRETRRSLELTHPHIIRIYDFVQDGRAAAISMEFVPGDTLAALKADRPNRPFEPAEIERWVQQLCEALTYAHERALVVHRDLKPANLMVDGYGDLKIADFGIAASVSDSVSRVSVRAGSSGTPVYMSPQQMMGEKPAVTDDIYSVGATLYDLITGRPPFYSGNVIAQVQGKVPPRMSARREELEKEPGVIPESWERAVAACLAKEPQDRPQRAAEIIQRIRAAVAAEPPPVPKPKPVEMAPPPLVVATPATVNRPEPTPAPQPPVVKVPDAPPQAKTTELAKPITAVPEQSVGSLAAAASAPGATPPPPTPPPPTPLPPTPPTPAPGASKAEVVEKAGAEPIPTPDAPAAEAVKSEAVAPPPATKEAKKSDEARSTTPTAKASALKYNAGGEAPKTKSKPPMPVGEATSPKKTSSLRYGAAEETPAKKPGGDRTRWYIAAAAGLMVVAAGYYFVIHRPAVERARVAALETTARTDLDRLVTEVRTALGQRAWSVAEARLTELEEAITTWPAEVQAGAGALQTELRGELTREREADRVAALRVPVTLTSSPAGAEVVIDGESRGVTPLSRVELPIGEHSAILRLKDHEELPVKFTVTERGPGEWTWPLVRSRGWLQVAGLPQGAGFKVYPIEASGGVGLMPAAEGRLPAGRLELPVGSYEVVVTSAGSGPPVVVRSRLEVKREEVSSVNGDVRGASVRVTSNPTGATVLVDGKVEGTTPVLLAGQPYGARQQIELRLEGHDAVRQSIQFPANADEVGNVAVRMPEMSGARLRPDLAKGPTRLQVENRARYAVTMRTTTNGQTQSSGPTESVSNSRELFTFAEPGADGLWQRARSELTEGPGFQPGTVVEFSRGTNRWVARLARGGFTSAGVTEDYLFPSYPGLILAREVLPLARAETGRTWDVPLSLTALVVPGSRLTSPEGSIKAEVKSVDRAATPAWAEVEYKFDVSGAMEPPAGVRGESRGREVGTLTVRVMLQDGYVARAQSERRTVVEGTTTNAAGATTSFVSEVVSHIDTTASIPTAASSGEAALFTLPSTAATPAATPATSKSDGTIYNLSQVTRAPRAQAQSAPNYPAKMQRAGIEGSVQVEFVIDPAGKVSFVQVLESTNLEFEAPALAAVRTWRFTPAQKDGRAVAVRVRTQVTFNLAD